MRNGEQGLWFSESVRQGRPTSSRPANPYSTRRRDCSRSPKRFQSFPLQDTPEEIRDWKRNAFENGSASVRRHAEAQRLHLIQQGANLRYEAGAPAIEQQSQCTRQTEAKRFRHPPGEGIGERGKQGANESPQSPMRLIRVLLQGHCNLRSIAHADQPINLVKVLIKTNENGNAPFTANQRH